MTDKGKFRIDTLLPVRDGYTISRNADMGKDGAVTYFSMGAHTSISQESYDSPSIYLGCRGKGTFWLGENGEGRSCQPVRCLSFQEERFADPKPKTG